MSIHIPKTAGRTFQKILQDQYGIDGVLCLNHHYLTEQKEELKEHPTFYCPVLHGHLPYQQISTVGNPYSKYITWLRHPVARVISNYYFYCSSEYPNLKRQNPSKKLIPLKRFIRRQNRRNVMTRYLEGIALEDLFFVGFQEQFDKDIDKLGKKLGWRLTPEHLELRINDNTKTKQAAPPPSAELIEKIRQYNSLDIALYEKAKALAHQGYWD